MLLPFKGLVNAFVAADDWIIVRVIIPLVIVALAPRFTSAWWREGACLLAAVCGGVGVVLAYGGGALQALGSFLVNAVYIGLLIAWAHLYARLPMSGMIMAVAGTYTGGSVLYFLLTLAPGYLVPGIVFLLPCASVLCLWIAIRATHGAQRKARGHTSVDMRRFLKSFPLKLALVAAAYSFVYGINSNSASTERDILSAGIVGLTLFALLLCFGRTTSLYSVFRLVLPTMMVGLVVSQFVGEETGLAGLIAPICFGLAETVTILVLCDLSYRFGMDAIRANAAERLIIGVTFVAASVLNGLLSSSSDGLLFLQCVEVAFAIAASAVWLSSDRDAGDPMLTLEKRNSSNQESAEGFDVGSDVPSLRSFILQQCEQLTGEYHLSPRESEVLFLLGCGLSAKLIEKELYLSPSTVKTHIRHIYAKLGIHSKDELRILMRLDSE